MGYEFNAGVWCEGKKGKGGSKTLESLEKKLELRKSTAQCVTTGHF